jgi:Ca2+:H+ antiporter
MFSKLDIGKPFYWMLLFIPLTFVVAFWIHNLTLLFIVAVLALIPIARIVGFATKEISLQVNPTIGGLVSATFGNIIELIIAIIALKHGLVDVVKGSIIGSIIGNILFLVGLAVLFGGIKFKHQRFNSETAGISSTMLIIAIAGLAIPTIYGWLSSEGHQLQLLSDSVAIVMAVIYILGLVFSLVTHKELFDAADEIKKTKEKSRLTKKQAFLVLLIGTALAALVSENLVGSIEAAGHSLSMSDTFIGVIIIAIVTNVAENLTAISFAMKNRLDISLEIGLSSAIQIALFVVPILVIISHIFGYGFELIFMPFHIISMFFAVLIINHLAADGKTHWLEGAQLISIYLIIAVVFFFI